MLPFSSYTSLQIVHDQKIEEALEKRQISVEQAGQKQGIFHKLGAFLARTVSFDAHKSEQPFCDCEIEARGTASL